MASFYSLGELILITPDLSSISIGFDTTDAFEPRTITVAENKLTTTGASFGNIEENIYVNSDETGRELLVKDGYKIKYVEYPKTTGNGGTSYKPGTTFNSVRDSTKNTYISIEAVSSKVSIDLTTLTGWDNVTDGEHQISVVAKATGYRDSAKSTPITFTKASVSTGETWLLNEDLSSASSISADVNFISHSTNYIKFSYQSSKGGTLYYVTAASGEETPYMTGSWTNTAYKTITFSTAPTGALLTWLQANGTKQGGSSVSKNWKFNGTAAFAPQKTYGNYVTISGEAYNDTTFVANFDYIYYADDWSYITFGSAGFWDISQNQYGKNGGNILKFNTEPSGELLAFLQAHAQPI